MARFWDRYGRSYSEKSDIEFNGYIKYTIQRNMKRFKGI